LTGFSSKAPRRRTSLRPIADDQKRWCLRMMVTVGWGPSLSTLPLQSLRAAIGCSVGLSNSCLVPGLTGLCRVVLAGQVAGKGGSTHQQPAAGHSRGNRTAPMPLALGGRQTKRASRMEEGPHRRAHQQFRRALRATGHEFGAASAPFCCSTATPGFICGARTLLRRRGWRDNMTIGKCGSDAAGTHGVRSGRADIFNPRYGDRLCARYDSAAFFCSVTHSCYSLVKLTP